MRRQTNALLLNFSKAFDSVPHQRLLIKLNYCGVGVGTSYVDLRFFLKSLSSSLHIQLFRERLSGKVHATILKGIVVGFEFFFFFQRNLKELVRKGMEMCLRALKENNKSRFDSYSRREQCIDHIPCYLSGLSRAHFFQQPFSK